MFQLTIRHILERARLYFSKKEIVSRVDDGQIVRHNYKDLYDRVCRLASALQNILKVRPGDKVASLCWNTHRHLELHFAVPCINAVLHTVNVRFSPDEISYTINHAGDVALFVDSDMLPVVERITDKLESVERVVVVGNSSSGHVKEMFSYEELISRSSPIQSFPDIDENSPAAMCYTTGTTGMPKGVVYTHRGIFLRSMATCMADTYALSEGDTILHVVPMYHISSWFMPYAATMVGAKQVLPGPRPRVEDIYQLIKEEKVTVSDGVPTIWSEFLGFIRGRGAREDLRSLRKLIVGGSAPSKALIRAFKEEFGVSVLHAWGMTETYDSASTPYIKSYLQELPDEMRYDIASKQGLPFPAIEVNAIDEAGNPIAWDDQAKGELIIRGAWVATEYYRDPQKTRESFIGEWLRTGDVVTIDEEGYIRIVDRVKDLIRSGGEWISSIQLENELMAHPAVNEAAVIAVPHSKWGERPLACVVLKPEFVGKVSKKDVLSILEGRVAKWQIPDDVVFLDEIPKTSVGKFDKKALRKMLAAHYEKAQ